VSGARPRPEPSDPDAARFWEYVMAGELRLQRCATCGRFRHPPAPRCAGCAGSAAEWVRAKGGGEVWTYTVVHPPTLPAFADRTPYGAVVVRLDEGVFMVSNVVDCPVDALTVGMRVECAVTDVGDGLRLPLFRQTAT
jgi:uncharacterized OB-fold protein